MRMRTSLSFFAVLAVLFVGIFVSQAQADVAILDSLSEKGYQIAVLSGHDMSLERAKGTNYNLYGTDGGTWYFVKPNGTLAATKRDFVATRYTTSSNSGVLDNYYKMSGSSVLMYTYNTSTRRYDYNSSMPVLHWQGSGWTYVSGYGTISGLSRLPASSIRYYDL